MPPCATPTQATTTSVVRTRPTGAVWPASRTTVTRDASFTEIIGAIAVIGKRDGALTEDEDNDPNTALTANEENTDIRADADADTTGQQDMRHYWAEEAGADCARG